MFRFHNFTSNKQLIDSLRGTYVQSDGVAKAMMAVDRKHFTESDPYSDCPQAIGYGVTISAPHMHGISLSLLEDFLKPGMKGRDYFG
jgi:protein-L-isoaspartate(D-aspartate) O-methyltransferase